MERLKNIKIDFKAPEFDNEHGKYYSMTYQMNTSSRETQKEFDKTYHIKDTKKRIERIKYLIGDKNHNRLTTHATKVKIPDYKKLGFKAIDDFINKQKMGMFYGVWVEVATLRRLELEYYLQNIFNEAEKIKANKSDILEYLTNDKIFNTVCYLIDQQYKEHTGVLSDTVSDALFSDEYNQIIYDYIGKMIKSLSEIDIETEKSENTVLQKSKIKWNGNSNELYTLFSDMLGFALIETEKANLARFICANFSDKDNKDFNFDTVKVYLSKEETSKKRVEFSAFFKPIAKTN